MADDRDLVADVRSVLSDVGTIREVRMFGGTAFLLNGNMVAAASPRGLLLRVGAERHEAALARPGARPMVMRGHAMNGYVYADPWSSNARRLRSWLGEPVAFVRTLPPKTAGTSSVRKGKSR